jgi:hypothetical protein
MPIPMRRDLQEILYKRGDKVRHWDFGAGIVLCSWHTIYSCRECHKEYRIRPYVERNRHHKGQILRGGVADCHCNAGCREIYAEDVFDIVFNSGEIHAINQINLTPRI